MIMANGSHPQTSGTGAWTRRLSGILTAGVTLILLGCGGGGGGGTATNTPTGTAPSITAQPQPQTLMTGSTATFSVTATGTAPLSYQWLKSGTPISGATGASYTTPTVTLTDSGASFTVTVTNSAGSVTSSGAKLSANADPEGLYMGTISYATAGTSLPIFAIVLKDGTAAAFVTDHVLPVNAPVGYSLHGLAVNATGANFTSSFTALLQSGYVFNNGQRTSNGTLAGTIAPGVSISGSFTSDLDHGSFVLNAMTSDYNRAATLATTAGTYKYDSAYFDTTAQQEKVFEATTNGAADGSGSATTTTGCTSTGSTTTIPDPAHNAYKVTALFTCPVPPNAAPTLTFTALSAFFPAGTGAGIVGTNPFTSDTVVIITDDVPDQVAFMIVSAKQ